MLKLFLLRHAHAPRLSGQTDRKRELDGVGYQEAEAVNKFLSSYKIDKVICSDAPRIKQTLSKILNIPSPQYLPKLYNAEANEIMAEVMNTPISIKNLLVVGHNPGITSVINLIDIDYKDARQYSLTHNFNVTAKLVILAIQSSKWDEIRKSKATVENLFYP